MKSKKKFMLSMLLLQFLFVILVFTVVNSLIPLTIAQEVTDAAYNAQVSAALAFSAAIAIAGAVLGAAMAIKTVGTAAISALTENEGVFFKAFLVIALGEALAIYGLIVAILLWIKIPNP